MNSKTVRLIATDPPFNKGRDFHATPDSLADGASFQDRWSWDEDVHPEWVDQLKDDWPSVMQVIQGSRASYGDDMGAFLCFMAVRLIEMHRILLDDGSIYLHCDPTASHYLKSLLDAIFGRKNFRNEIIWHHPKIGIASKKFTSNTDTLLFYTKSSKYSFNPIKSEEPNELAKRWKSKIRGMKLYYKEAKTIKDSPAKSKIKVLEKKLKRPLKDHDVVMDFNDKANKKSIDNVWKFSFIKGNSQESTGYPTQKPLALYKRIIKASSSENDIVLDPFCGCATTPIAAELLGRQWVGIDIWDEANKTVIERLQFYELAAPDSDKLEIGKSDKLITYGQIIYKDETDLPKRTDDGVEAVPFLTTKLRVDEPKRPKKTRKEMYDFLLSKFGSKCQGCDRSFKDSRYLELDHNTPRSDGGLNHISNRILLCSPCNRLKSNTLTLSGLRGKNKKQGFMADQE